MERTLSLLVKFAALDKLTAPLKRMRSGAAEAGKELAVTKREVVKLEQSSARVAGYRAQQTAIAKTAEKLEYAARRVDALKAAMVEATGPTGRLSAQLVVAERTLQRTGDRAAEQRAKLDALGAELKSLGVDTGDLAGEEKRLAASIETANRALDAQAAKAAKRRAQQERIAKAEALGSRMQSTGTAMIAGGAAVAAPAVITARAAIDYESSFADVQKLVDGTAAQMAQLNAGMLALSKRVPIDAAGIASIVALGARSGVARAELLAFAEDAAKMGVAFDMSAEEAGGTMAKWRSAFKLTQTETVALGDRINALTNAYGGNVAAVSEMVTRIGPLGEVAGVAAPSIAAIAQLMNSVGIESEIGATGIKNMMLALTKGTAATKSQKAAWKALGLDASAVAAGMQKDSEKTILNVLQRLSKIPDAARPAMLENLFGSESIAAIAPLLTNLDALGRNYQLAGDQARYAGSMQREFESRSGTTANKLQIMSNRVDVLKIRLGNALLPSLVGAAEAVGALADRFEAFFASSPASAQALMIILTVVGALMIGVGGLAIALGTIVGPLTRGWAILSRLAGPLRMLGGLLRFLVSPLQMIVRVAGMALAAIAGFLGVPLIVAGAIVVGVGLIALAIYNHWESIKGWTAAAWAWLVGAFTGAWNTLVNLASSLWTGIRARFTAGLAWLAALPGRFFAFGAEMGRGLVNGIGSMFGALKARIEGLGKAAIGWFRGVLGIKSPSRVFAGLGGMMMDGLRIGLDRGATAPLAAVRASGKALARTMAATSLAATIPATAAPAPPPVRTYRPVGGAVRDIVPIAPNVVGPDAAVPPGFPFPPPPPPAFPPIAMPAIDLPAIVAPMPPALTRPAAAEPTRADPVVTLPEQPAGVRTVPPVEGAMLRPALQLLAARVDRLALRAAPAATAALDPRGIDRPAAARLLPTPDAPAITVVDRPAIAGGDDRRAAPRAPAPAAMTFTGPITITLQQQPGEDGADLAERIQQALRDAARQDNARAASRYQDTD